MSWGLRTDLPAGNAPTASVTADFNHDANLDLAVTNQLSSTVSVWLGDGRGGFGQRTDYPAGPPNINQWGSHPLALVAADFNGDGNIDLAVTTHGWTGALDYYSGVTVLPGDGTGRSGPGIYTGVYTHTTTDLVSTDLSAADLNGDGKMDLVVPTYGVSQVAVLLGQGNGHFTATNYTVPTGPFSVAVGDFNGDGNLDLAVADRFADYVSVLLGDGNGGFGPIHTYPTGSNPVSVTAVDVNHDTKLDLIVPNGESGTVSVLLGDGTGGFAARADYVVGNSAGYLAAADFNRDGNVDLAVTVPRMVKLLLGDGKGGFSLAPGGLSPPSGPAKITSGDFNGDGTPDLATADSQTSNAVSVWLNYTRVAPAVTGVAPSAGPTGGGNAVTITGGGFVSGASVKFGSTASGSVSVQSATKLTAIAPAHALGSVDVTVTTAFGTSATSSADRYTYASYAQTVLSTPGLLAYWRLGETSGTTAEDELSAHDGSYQGGYMLGQPGALLGEENTAVSLDGTGFVRLPALGTASTWTIEGWTNLNQDASASPNGNNALYAHTRGVRLLIRPAGFYVDDGSNRYRNGIISRRGSSNINQWVYWALVRDGSTLTLYRDATAVAHSTLTTAGDSKLNGILGANQGTYFLHGRADELAVYNAPLTAATIKLHYDLAGHA